MTALQKTPSIPTVEVVRQMLGGLSIDLPINHNDELGVIVRWRIGRRVFFGLSHPDYVDHVFHDGCERYSKSIEYELLRSVVGLSLFTDEGESWRHHRMLMNPLMGRRHLNGMVDLMVDPIERFTDEIESHGDGHELDMVRAMTELTLEVVGSALFGRGLGDVARRLGPAVTGGLRAAEVAARLTFLLGPPVWGVRAAAGFVHRVPMVVPQLRRIQWVMNTIDEIVWDIVRERRANPRDSDDLVGLLMSTGELSDKRVRDELVTFMLAGHETTANGLAWMWYLLALNPDTRERMLEEVDGVVGTRSPTAADVPNLPWTMACFQEALRFYSPAWVIPRTAVADDEIAGHRIPKGATVLIPTHTIHHDARFWPDPERFDPSRFLPGEGKGRHRSAYLPFGAGRRVCIGASFALMEGTLITAIMSRRSVYGLVPGHPVEPETTLTVRPRYGMKMIARDRFPAAEAAA